MKDVKEVKKARELKEVINIQNVLNEEGLTYTFCATWLTGDSWAGADHDPPLRLGVRLGKLTFRTFVNLKVIAIVNYRTGFYLPGCLGGASRGRLAARPTRAGQAPPLRSEEPT